MIRSAKKTIELEEAMRALVPGRGRLLLSVPMAPTTWFRVGGVALAVYRPADLDDLVDFAQGCSVPLLPLGMCSNVIIRDGGLEAVVVRLTGAEWSAVRVQEGIVHAGAGALDRTIAEFACVEGLEGLEFLAGIPGTIGAAVRMNAGCYGREIKDILVSVDVLMPDGRLMTLSPAQCGFSYRASTLPEGAFVVQVRLRATPGDPKMIVARMHELLENREKTQPVRARTGGSTFQNPEGRKAWQLIDQAGCRGLRVGGAEVSDIHCNFMINRGDATAKDLETLGEQVRQRVFEHSGILLAWEVERLGYFIDAPVSPCEAALATRSSPKCAKTPNHGDKDCPERRGNS